MTGKSTNHSCLQETRITQTETLTRESREDIKLIREGVETLVIQVTRLETLSKVWGSIGGVVAGTISAVLVFIITRILIPH